MDASDEQYVVSSVHKIFDDEDAEIVAKQIEDINEWLEENPEINAMKCDARNLMFLRGCKYNLDKTKKKIRRLVLK